MHKEEYMLRRNKVKENFLSSLRVSAIRFFI